MASKLAKIESGRTWTLGFSAVVGIIAAVAGYLIYRDVGSAITSLIVVTVALYAGLRLRQRY